MTRIENYVARAGVVLLGVSVIPVGWWLFGGGSARLALLCLIGSLGCFGAAWVCAWKLGDPADPADPAGRAEPDPLAAVRARLAERRSGRVPTRPPVVRSDGARSSRPASPADPAAAPSARSRSGAAATSALAAPPWPPGRANGLATGSANGSRSAATARSAGPGAPRSAPARSPAGARSDGPDAPWSVLARVATSTSGAPRAGPRAGTRAGPRPEGFRPVPAPPRPAADLMFPIASYDELWAAEILPLLPELDDAELELVLGHEEAGAARSSIVNRIEVLLGRRAGPDGNHDDLDGD